MWRHISASGNRSGTSLRSTASCQVRSFFSNPHVRGMNSCLHDANTPQIGTRFCGSNLLTTCLFASTFAELKSASSQAGKKSKGKTQFPGLKSRAVSKGVVKPTVKPSQGQIALGGATVSVPLAWFILPLRRALSAPIKPSSARPWWHPCFASMAFLMQALYVNSLGCVGVKSNDLPACRGLPSLWLLWAVWLHRSGV